MGGSVAAFHNEPHAGFGSSGGFDREHRAVHDELAQPDFRLGKRPGKQAPLVAVERGHGVAHELADVRRPPRRLHAPTRRAAEPGSASAPVRQR